MRTYNFSFKSNPSQLHLHEFKVSQHDHCEILVTILPESNSGGKHKVKIAGLTISEGGGDGLKNNLAIDMVMEGISAGNTTEGHKNFEMRTWGRLHH